MRRAALMAARPAELVDALNHHDRSWHEGHAGAFPVGPTFGTDYSADGSGGGHADGQGAPGAAHRRHQRRRGTVVHPVPPAVAHERADDREAVGRCRRRARERITAAYPDYPSPAACIQFGGDFAFGSAAWQIAEAHGQHAPTYLYRYDYAPRTLRWSGLGATHATELFAVFDVYRTRFGSLLTAAADRQLCPAGQSTMCSRGGGPSAAPGCPARTGLHTPRMSGR